MESFIERQPIVDSFAVETNPSDADAEQARLAAHEVRGVGDVELDAVVPVGEEHLGRDRTDALVRLGDRHHRPEPARIDRGIVVHQCHVVVVAGDTDAEVAAAGKAEILEWFEHPDTPVALIGGHPLDHVVERAVVDHHDVEPIARPVGGEQRVEALHGHVATVEVQHDDADDREVITHESAEAIGAVAWRIVMRWRSSTSASQPAERERDLGGFGAGCQDEDGTRSVGGASDEFGGVGGGDDGRAGVLERLEVGAEADADHGVVVDPEVAGHRTSEADVARCCGAGPRTATR